MNKLAFMYDFDDTLSKKNEQFKTLFHHLDISQDEFWNRVYEKCAKFNMDSVLAFMYEFRELAKAKNIILNKSFLNQCGKDVTYFNGVEEWFDRINKFGANCGFEIEHYIISCGLQNILEGTNIAKKFKKIFASCYAFNETNTAYWPSMLVNFSTKIQYVFRIKKGLLYDLSDSSQLNKKWDKSKVIPYSNMIYFGDGGSDVPCMKVVKDKGGTSIALFRSDVETSKQKSLAILNDGRVDIAVEADYSENSDLDIFVKEKIKLLQKMNEINDIKQKMKIKNFDTIQ